jgi:hypothetical protein
MYLVIDSITATEGGEGGETDSPDLRSDVLRQGSVFNDQVSVTLHIEQKNTQFPTTALNAVTMQRYRVNFRRTDGQNRPGIDVPYGFDGAVTGTINPGDTRSFVFEIVRHQSKLEPPLSNLVRLGGSAVISTVAEITMWGRDQNGNEVVVTGAIDVHFADFGDPA